MSEKVEPYVSDSDAGYWGKLEIMGHEVYYGFIRELEHGRVAIDIYHESGMHTKKFGPSAIFGMEPLGREEVIALAERSHYEASPLDYSEQTALVEGKYELDETLDVVREAGYTAKKDQEIEAQAKAIARVAGALHLVSVSDEGEKLSSLLVNMLESALERTIPLGKAKGLIQQVVTELEERAEDHSPEAILQQLRDGIEIDFGDTTEMPY